MTQMPERSNSVWTIIIAIYMFILGLLTFIPALAVVGCGGLLGGLAASVGSTEGNVAGGLITILGLVGLGLGIAMFVYGFGLITTKPWAYMGAIVLNVIYIGFQLLSAVTSSSLGISLSTAQIVFMVLSAGSIYILLTDADIRVAFGR